MAADWVFDVTEKDFAQEVVEKSRQTPVVVDFWAPWCGPCRMLAPLLEKHIANRKGEILLAKVNIDEEQGLAATYGVQSIPLVVGFRDGKPHSEFMGLVNDSQLVDFLDRLSPSQADREARSGSELEKKDPAQAEALYRKALEDDPGQETAILGLARMLLQRRELAEAEKLLANVGLGGDNGQEAERLAALIWLQRLVEGLPPEGSLRDEIKKNQKNTTALYQLGCVLAGAGNYPDALAAFLQAGEKDTKLATTKVREAMVKIFQVVGVRSELSDDYRAKLATLLY